MWRTLANAFMKMVSPCWRSSAKGDDSRDRNGRINGLLWYKDLGENLNGEFSMAVVQANSMLEDQSRIESGPLSSCDSGPQGTFVGIYDGHAGAEASRYLNEHLFSNLKRLVWEQQGMSGDVIHKAFIETEEGFLSLVRKQWLSRPQILSVGSCCLVGIICRGTLYVGNAGDSRVVLGRIEKATRQVVATQLSTEHNASIDTVREEMRSLHPDDPQIVVLRHKVWRVKGIIQVTRSLGDAYLKKTEFNRDPLQSKFRLPPFEKPLLRPDPSILVHKIKPQDQFLIFASDGLWEHLSNQEAVDIVHHNPHNGIAKKLVKSALQRAAKKREMRYSDLKKIDRGVRRHFHDDITVIVLFLSPNGISKALFRTPTVSMRGGGGPTHLNTHLKC